MKSKRLSKFLAGSIENQIYLIRNQRVMLDGDLAELYGVPTRALNQAIKRNLGRFPADFVFQLTPTETANWMSQIVTSKPSLKMGLRKPPYAFTEHGALMAAYVLKSSRAVQMSVFVMRAFVRMRSLLAERQALAKQLAILENKLSKRLDAHEIAIVDILRKLMTLLGSSRTPVRVRPPVRIKGFSKD